jgi:hypothetical protein
MLVLGAEIGMLVYGIATLWNGRATLGKGKYVQGRMAVWIGLICMAPMPLAFMTGLVFGFIIAVADLPQESFFLITLAEVGILLTCLAIAYALGKKYGRTKQEWLDLRAAELSASGVLSPQPYDGNNPYRAPRG